MEEGLERPQDKNERYLELATLNVDLLTTVFGLGLGSAVLAHLFIRWFGWVFGGAAAVSAIYFGAISKWGVGPRVLKRILKVDALEGPPVWELLPSGEEDGELLEVNA
jgi:hypothetical protein